MRLSMPARLARFGLAVGLVLSVGAPAAAPVAAADPVVLKLGTIQAIDSVNPYQAALVESYEAFELTYDQLVGFGPNLEPVPAFAASWTRNPDGTGVTFKFRPDLKWSDGQPATSEDACFSWQLDLDAIAKDESVGLGYLDPGIKDAGVTKVECPDPTTMIVTTSDPSNRVFQTYVPILPKHIWGKETYKTIADADFSPPKDGSGLVGTGAYQLVEYKEKQFARFKRNPNYWGQQGFADEIVMQFFSSNDTLFQALKKGEIDYARKISPEQFKQLQGDPVIKAVNGASNGWTELGFNTYGTGTGKTIKGGGPSTKALQDPAFRDALGYAIDKQKLVDSVIGGLGTIGTTQIPPVNKPWHTEPTDVRTFDLTVADQKLTAAGYLKDASGKRLDKAGKPISLRMVLPDYDPNFAKDGQFIRDWFAQLGITVTPKVYDSDTLVDRHAPAGGRRGDQQGRLRPVHLGPGRGVPTRTTPSTSSSATPSATRRTACGATPTTTSCMPISSWHPRTTHARPSSPRCSRCGTTPPLTTSCTTTTTSTPIGPTSSRAGRTSRRTGHPSSPTGRSATRCSRTPLRSRVRRPPRPAPPEPWVRRPRRRVRLLRPAAPGPRAAMCRSSRS